MWAGFERRPYGALALFALLMFLPGLWSLPPVDRDEARFAQATKQMLETGDFVDIRFQDTPRHKKPIGIYWLQAASVAAFTGAPWDAIWAYRIPSLLGAILAVLLTYWWGRPLFGPRAALFGAMLLAATVMLAAEARLAKTDAALLATIVAAQGVLARAYLLPKGTKLDFRLVVMFWLALGLGVLLKGPIAPLALGLTMGALALADRRADFVARLRPLPGLALLVLVSAPWFIAVGLATKGQFFAEAIGGDLLPKLAGGQESHGAPPGTYAALALVTFWPAALVLGPALVWAFHERRLPAVRVALAAALPLWLIFELVPTKLPHYVLPAYPALALLCGAAIEAALKPNAKVLGTWLGHAALATYVLAGFALALALATLRPAVDGPSAPLDVLLGLAVVASVAVTLLMMMRRQYSRALTAALASGALLAGGAFGVLAPSLTAPWIAPRLVALLPHDATGARAPLAATGFAEPSLVFLAGTETRLLPPRPAAASLVGRPTACAAVSLDAEAAFRAEAQRLGLTLAVRARTAGYNYSIGKPVLLALFCHAPGSAPP